MSRRIAAYTQERTVEGMSRDEVCRRYGPKVQLIARRVWDRLYPDGATGLEDLASLGAIGLLEAFDRFDPSRGIKFATYAEYRIRGAIYDGLRGADHVSRRGRQLARRVERTHEHLERALGRPPTHEEAAAHLGRPLDQYWTASELASRPAPGGEPALVDVLADPDAPVPVDRIVAHELRVLLEKAILELPERQRTAVVLYYAKELQLAEIAEVFEVTPSRVSQILTEARLALRKKLAARAFDAGDVRVGEER